MSYRRKSPVSGGQILFLAFVSACQSNPPTIRRFNRRVFHLHERRLICIGSPNTRTAECGLVITREGKEMLKRVSIET